MITQSNHYKQYVHILTYSPSQMLVGPSVWFSYCVVFISMAAPPHGTHVPDPSRWRHLRAAEVSLSTYAERITLLTPPSRPPALTPCLLDPSYCSLSYSLSSSSPSYALSSSSYPLFSSSSSSSPVLLPVLLLHLFLLPSSQLI